MAIGTVKFFNYDRGYGFISNDDGGADAFVHITAVEAAGLPGLNKDERISYDVETGSNGKSSAVNLQAA
jgi:CspA family cold shock protein